MVLISRAALGADADASFDAWTASKGQWKTRNHVYCQNLTETDCRSFCGLNGWTDYVYEVQARKVAGAEGFLVLFRVKDASSFYWWNIGGWSNRQHGLETRGGARVAFPRVNGGIETGKWYDIKVVVKGPTIECYLDGKQIHKVNNGIYKTGGVGLGSWSTRVQYRNVKVTAPDGTVLYKTRKVDHTPGEAEMTNLTAAEKAARAKLLEKMSSICGRVAFIRRRGYGMRGTNATMFSRRTGQGAAICILDTGKPGDAPLVIFETKEGFIFDMNPSYDGKKLVFSYKEKTDQPFHIWEIATDGTGLRQLTGGPYHDVSPVYYPDGRIIFTSSRVESFSLCQDFLASALHICDGDGTNLRRIDFTTLCSCSPSVTSDGNILFTRWEYQDKNIFSWEGLWTIQPDGRQLRLYHGNTLTIPNAVYGAEEIPGTKKAILTMAAHHHVPIGDIAIVNRALGLESVESMKQITFATGYRVTKGKDWRHNNWGPGDRFYVKSFVDPFPIDKDYSLVSDGRTGRFGIALLSHDGNVVPVYSQEECFNPVPLAVRPLPHKIPGECPQEAGYGTFFVQDVYMGLTRQGVKRGQVKRLRIMAQSPKKYNTEGPRYHDHYPIVGQGTYYVKINHGTVPVEENGAAYFKAPSNVELYFQALDENGKEIIRMGSVTQITTGEHVSCVGCHEDRLNAPPVRRANMSRMSRPPDDITPPPWGGGEVDYVKHVQPVLNKYCIKCHSGPEPKKGINLTGDKTRFYSMSYESLVFRGYVDYFYINQGPTGNFPALSTGSWVSKLTKLIETKHGKVDVEDAGRRAIYAWIDANVPYYGTWEMSRPYSQGGRDLLTIPAQTGRPKRAPWVDKLKTVCAQKKVKIDANTVNFTHPELTPGLVGLLAKSAGGAAPNETARFKRNDDPEYVALISVLEQARDTVREYPRIDMPGARAIPQKRDFGRVY
jgi:hypothetical protein